MPNELFDIIITIKKRTGTENALGELEYVESDRYTNIKARKETVNELTQYNKLGQRKGTVPLIYIPAIYDEVEIQDRVYIDNAFYGIVVSIARAYLANNQTSHYELLIEIP